MTTADDDPAHLLELAELALVGSRNDLVLELLDKRRALLEGWGFGPADPTWHIGRRLRVDALFWSLRLDQAQDEAARFVADASQLGDPRIEALSALAMGALGQHESPTEATRWLRQALDGFRAVGDFAHGAHTCILLSSIRASRGDQTEARELLELALELLDRVDSPATRCRALHWLGVLRRREGDLDGAAEAFQRALDLARLIPYPLVEAACHQDLAMDAAARGRLEEALSSLTAAYRVAVALDSASFKTNVLNRMGELHRKLGQLELAVRAYRSALEVAPGRHRVLIAVNLGMVTAARGDWEAAEGAFRDALEGDPRLMVLRLASWLGRCAAAARRGDLSEATSLWNRAAVAEAESGSADPDLAWLAEQVVDASLLEPGGALLAARATGLVVRQRQLLGQQEATQAALERLAELPAGTPVPLGPFVLISQLGAGGAGEVWRARHTSGLAVALKVAGSETTDLTGELQATAVLDHPYVAWVLHAGVIDEAAASMDAGLIVGSRWVATELIEGETLERYLGALSFQTVRRVLLCLLDALAHAHARGLTHMDVKPGNILLRRTEAGVDAVLVDFGGAQTAGTYRPISGTPLYAAPEQFAKDRRAFGPWTDLYALGVVAWEMVCGDPPWDFDTFGSLQQAHQNDPPPPLTPRVPVPAGLEAWIHRAMAKSPFSRFRRAADAAAALARLPLSDGDAPELVSPSLYSEIPPSMPTLLQSDTPTKLLPSELPTLNFDLEEPSDRLVVDGPGVVVAPAPRDWRTGAPRPRRAALHDAGLGLFRLRTPRMVGREHERNLLWTALLEASAGGPRAIWLESEPGGGASRLARWVGERAYEVGAASVVSVAFAEGRDEQHVEQQAVARYLGVDGLPDDAPRRTVVVPTVVPPGSVDLDWLLVHGVSERPLVVWLDDVQHAPQAVARLPTWLDGSGRLLLVLTAPSGLEPPDHRGILAWKLGSLPASVVGELLDGMLPLESALRNEVIQRAGGNPARATEVLTDLVVRDRLVLRSGRYQLREGAVVPG